MSDTDYINDHMGGFDSDGLPSFLSSGSGTGGMDGYGDVNYAFYHSDSRGLNSLLYAIRMAREAVKLLPYYLDDDNPDDLTAYSPELEGTADGWNEIYDIFSQARDASLASGRKDYFICIYPEKEVLDVTFVRELEFKDESSTVGLYIKPTNPEVDLDKWHFGLVSALEVFNNMLKHSYHNGSLSRLTVDQFDAYLAHKIAIRNIHLELEYLNKSDDIGAIKDKLIKDKLIELVTEMERFGSPTYKRANMDEIKILVEMPTKDNLMPTFKIEPRDCETYQLYEMSLKGDVISLHWMTNETLKEKYSLVDGTYSVPLLDLIKSRKLSSIYG